MARNQKSRCDPIVYALLSGILLNLIFPRWEWDVLAWVALIPLFAALNESASTRNSFFIGLVCGLVYFTGSCFWITNTMVNYGQLPFALSALILLLLGLYLALHVAVFSALYRFFKEKAGIFPALILSPFLWTFLELCRTYLFTGFPWNLLGYSQYRYPLVIQIADLTGVYGVSFFVCFVNAFFFFCILNLLAGWGKVSGIAISRKESLVFSTLALIIFSFVFSYGSIRLSRFSALEKGDPLTVSLVQGNIAQEKKWDPEFRGQVMEIYEGLTLDAAKTGVDLVVWPETATPFFFNLEKEGAERVEAIARQAGTYLLTGSPSVRQGEGRNRLRNSAYFLSNEGTVLGRYDKVKLVPFGEYVPMGKLLWFVEKMVVGIGDFLPGDAPVIMDHPKGRFGVLICFEIIFPRLARWNVREGARFLVNITNDAWFGESAGPFQHLSKAVFRAVENRVPIVRSANTGISAIINQAGKIESSTGIFTRRAITGKIFPGNGEGSFYSRVGDLFACLCGAIVFCSLAACVYFRKMNHQRRYGVF